MKSILLLFGGVSGEHEVSCSSASFLYKTLTEANYKVVAVYITRDGEWHYQENATSPYKIHPAKLSQNILYLQDNVTIKIDVVFPIIHGTMGEDGCIQGFCEINNLPYVGCGVLASANCMDKKFSHMIFSATSIAQVDYLTFRRHEWQVEQDKVIKKIHAKLTYPIFVKPANMGSSVGISKVQSATQLNDCVEEALLYDDVVVCEAGIDARELEIAILGNYPNYKVSCIAEIIPKHEFYSYEAKYEDADGATILYPAKCHQESELKELAIQAFCEIHGDGFARIDFFEEKQTGKLYLNEINTLPGFTEISMFPKLWQASGIEPVELMKEIVDLAEKRFAQKKRLSRTK